MRPFAEVKAEIEAKFVDLELKVLTVLQFDFDYAFGTPFRFIRMFLQTHYAKLGRECPPLSSRDRLEDFGKRLYTPFDRTTRSLALRALY